jgi:hypothetical protein
MVILSLRRIQREADMHEAGSVLVRARSFETKISQDEVKRENWLKSAAASAHQRRVETSLLQAASL